MSKEFGIRLYYLRRHKTVYNHTHMAEKLGISRSAYTRYETGDAEPSMATLQKLKEILGVSYDELLRMPLSEEEIADYIMYKPKRKPSE